MEGLIDHCNIIPSWTKFGDEMKALISKGLVVDFNQPLAILHEINNIPVDVNGGDLSGCCQVFINF
jgi:hypothetical protein